jgi:cell division protein FtsW
LRYTLKSKVKLQIGAIALGIISFLLLSAIPYTLWKKFLPILIGASLILTLVALITPVNAQYPAHRWVRFSGLSFQTAEFVKLTLLIWAASFFSMKAARAELTDTKKTLRPALYIVGTIAFVIAGLQSDLGSAAVMVAIIVMLAYLAGMPLTKFVPLGAIVTGLVLVVFAASYVVPSLHYRVGRFNTFLNPTSDCQNAGYQSCQALIAVGSGGMTGKGLGKSVQATGYLPEAANDSIFAIMAEKFGFVGVTVIVGMYVAIFGRLKRIMILAPSLYARLLVAGVLAWFSTQTIINIGAMIGLLPLKGITLPFVSYGGTSLLFVTGALGLVFQVSRYTSFTNKLDESPEAGFDEKAMNRARPLVVRRRSL